MFDSIAVTIINAFEKNPNNGGIPINENNSIVNVIFSISL
jgi:hypothetical protein